MIEKSTNKNRTFVLFFLPSSIYFQKKDVECDRKDGLGEIKSKTMSQYAVIFLRHVVANRVKIGYTVSIELYINDLLRGWYKICLKNSR